MKFLLLTVDSHLHIGTFLLNLETRTWCFRYSDEFILNGSGKINEFSDVTKTYGHTSCVDWLSSRLGSITDNKKGVRLAEMISTNSSDNSSKVNEYLEIHPVQ